MAMTPPRARIVQGDPREACTGCGGIIDHRHAKPGEKLCPDLPGCDEWLPDDRPGEAAMDLFKGIASDGD